MIIHFDIYLNKGDIETLEEQFYNVRYKLTDDTFDYINVSVDSDNLSELWELEWLVTWIDQGYSLVYNRELERYEIINII